MNAMVTLATANVTVVGLGLIGGSLALALRPHVGRVTGVEIDAPTRRLAYAAGAVDVATPHFAAGLAETDVVLLATPSATIARQVGEVAHLRPDGCLVLDVGSSKEVICRAMDQLPAVFQAIGGHPMCGKEESGFAVATADLFQGQTFILCRTARTDEAAEATALALVAALGARPLFLDPRQHDELVSLVSHLPYFLSALLMEQAAQMAATTGEPVYAVSASGFRDTSRLAGSDPDMLRDIARTNGAAIIRRLRDHRERLDALIALLEHGDDAAVRAWLAARQQDYQAYRKEK
jgi:prephenate dehydrogenase